MLFQYASYQEPTPFINTECILGFRYRDAWAWAWVVGGSTLGEVFVPNLGMGAEGLNYLTPQAHLQIPIEPPDARKLLAKWIWWRTLVGFFNL